MIKKAKFDGHQILSILVLTFLACVSFIVLVYKKSNTKAVICSILPTAHTCIIVLINWLFTTIKGLI